MNQAETRAEHIDPALKVAGWGVVDGSRILREHGTQWASCETSQRLPLPPDPPCATIPP